MLLRMIILDLDGSLLAHVVHHAQLIVLGDLYINDEEPAQDY